MYGSDALVSLAMSCDSRIMSSTPIQDDDSDSLIVETRVEVTQRINEVARVGIRSNRVDRAVGNARGSLSKM
jgi:hypothetical protein